MVIKDMAVGAVLHVERIGIFKESVEVSLGLQIGSTPVRYGEARLHFTADDELLALIEKKIREAIDSDKIDTIPGYLRKQQTPKEEK